MLRAIRQHFIDSTKAFIKKSALMTEKDARRNTSLAITAPLLTALFLYIELTEPSQTIIMKCIVWWLIGMMALGTILFPLSLYGYHHRHRIDTSGEEPLDYGPSMAGALLGTALVPLGRMLFDYFNIN
ncbi:MAG: hypothetical protein ACRBM6_00625 [Geminicoccales bacterium]